jgi:hypothetical protein
MSDSEAQTTEEPAANQKVDEMTVLKQRARLLGVEFSNNIGLETLKERVRAKMEAAEEAENPTVAETDVNPLTGDNEVRTKPLTIREQLQRDEMKLVRVRITNLDPKKKDLPGEIFTVANEYLGTVTKYIPFGEVTDNGYHLPNCIFRQLEARKFLDVRTRKGADGQIKVQQGWAREFSLDVLPPLTQDELDKLATAQTAAGVFNPDV